MAAFNGVYFDDSAYRVLSKAAEGNEVAEYIIYCAHLNACETIFEDKEATPEKWGYIFLGTIGSNLANNPYDKKTIRFFEKHGIQY